MSRSRLAGFIAGGVFLYLLFWHFSTFAAFWMPITASADPSGNIAAILALVTPVVIAMLVLILLDKVGL